MWSKSDAMRYPITIGLTFFAALAAAVCHAAPNQMLTWSVDGGDGFVLDVTGTFSGDVVSGGVATDPASLFSVNYGGFLFDSDPDNYSINEGGACVTLVPDNPQFLVETFGSSGGNPGLVVEDPMFQVAGPQPDIYDEWYGFATWNVFTTDSESVFSYDINVTVVGDSLPETINSLPALGIGMVAVLSLRLLMRRECA